MTEFERFLECIACLHDDGLPTFLPCASLPCEVAVGVGIDLARCSQSSGPRIQVVQRRTHRKFNELKFDSVDLYSIWLKRARMTFVNTEIKFELRSN